MWEITLFSRKRFSVHFEITKESAINNNFIITVVSVSCFLFCFSIVLPETVSLFVGEGGGYGRVGVGVGRNEIKTKKQKQHSV